MANTSAFQILREKKEEIIHLWGERTRHKYPGENLPSLLDFLIHMLSLEVTGQELKSPSVADGKIKYDVSKYSIHDVFQVYQILRRCVLETLEKYLTLSSKEQDIIVTVIETEMAEAIKSYVEETKENLRIIEDRFNVATLSSGVGVWDYDITEDKAWRSLSHDKLHGYQGYIKDWNVDIALSHIHPDDRNLFLKSMTDAISQKKDWNVSYRLIWPDKSIHWICVKGKVITDDEGRPTRIIGTNVDISDQVEVKTLREKFIATISHDLRNPLGICKFAAQMLMKKITEPDLLQLAKKIETNMNRADEMIKNLLDVSYIRAGKKIPLEKEIYDLNGIIKEVLEDFRALHGERFVFNTTEVIRFLVDKEAFKRILENLLSNAVKYGSKVEPITVTLLTENSHIALIVHNCGEPIPANQIDSLFALHERMDNAIKGTQKGWGLGLTLVKGLVEGHHGKISVVSTKEEGTSFKITLPKL